MYSVFPTGFCETCGSRSCHIIYNVHLICMMSLRQGCVQTSFGTLAPREVTLRRESRTSALWGSTGDIFKLNEKLTFFQKSLQVCLYVPFIKKIKKKLLKGTESC